MHGELIYRHPGSGEERRAVGNATSVDQRTVQWELHDRGLGAQEREDHLANLEQLNSSGETVRISFVEASPPLEEVESGPRAAEEHSAPFEYGIVEIDRGKGMLTLRREDDGRTVATDRSQR